MSNYVSRTTCLMVVIVTTITLLVGVRVYLRTDSAAIPVESNSPPVAVNDSYAVHGYISVSGPGIVANDFDPDGNPISLSSCGAVAHGSLNCNTTYRSFFYEPASGYVGTDSFTYQICDNMAACSTGTVTLNVVNNAPVAVADVYVWQGSLVVPGPNALRENDSDANNDPISVLSYTQPAHGTANYSFSVGSLSYSPTAGYVGLDTFTYQLRDNLGLTSTATVYILVLPGAGPNAKSPYACCPTDPGSLNQFNPQFAGLAQASGGMAGASGPSWPDPVNLATGRETYAHDPDLEIYNPSGPAVAWQRHYSTANRLLLA